MMDSETGAEGFSSGLLQGQFVYWLMLCGLSLMSSKKKLPLSNLTNVGGLLAFLLTIVLGFLYPSIQQVIIVLWLPIIVWAGILVHVQNYMAYKAELRKAKKVYYDTGAKTPVYLTGYTGLGPLGLAVVVNIFGFAMCLLSASLAFSTPGGGSDEEEYGFDI